MSHLLISAAHKSSGKTTVSIGLCAALKARGTVVQPFKKGPDYIDPMWLSTASGRSCRNLDFYLMEQDEIVSSFVRHSADADISLIEGNKGLYDGLDLDGSNSNAALAELLHAPVILVIDARGMTRGIAPLILGYQAFDRNIQIAGVILNNLGGARHESKLRAVIEHYTDVPVIGAVHHDKRLQIVERHLGLMPSNEAEAAARRVNEIGEVVGAQVDLDKLLEIAASARPLTELVDFPHPNPDGTTSHSTSPADNAGQVAGYLPPAAEGANVSLGDVKASVRIGWAKDQAFGFYYADDLDALRAAGAELVPLDTLHDRHLPEIDGLFIGGGFPELFMKELEANQGLRREIGSAIERGMPTYAECGGLMYLARSLTWHGQKHEMVGVIPGDVVMHEKPVGRGYIRLRETGQNNWPTLTGANAAAEVRGHEFHYSSLDNLQTDGLKFAYEVKRGHGIDGRHDGIVYKNLLASYAHLRSLGNDNWAARFVAFVREKKVSGKRAA